MRTVYLITAPSGAGKTSLIKNIIENHEVKLGISYTTREARPGEIHGADYFFIDKNRFEAMIQAGDFFEYAEVFGNMYGTAKKSLELSTDVILEIDWQGALAVKEQLEVGPVVWIYIVPPSISVLEQRLVARNCNSGDIKQRLAQAKTDLEYARFADYIVFNDDFKKASRCLNSIILSEGLRTARHFDRIDSIIK